MTNMDYSKAKEHILGEKNFDPRFCGKCEAVMSQGNGYMGLRAAAEETYAYTTRGFFVAGTFDRFDEAEVSELPNAADCTEMELELNGQHFSLERGEVLQYSRELDLKTGLLTRNVLWKAADGNTWELSFERFVSLERLHDYVLKVKITLVDAKESGAVPIAVTSGINGQITNTGTQHFSDGDKRYYEKKYLQLVQTTSESGISFVHSAVHGFRGIEINRMVQMPRRCILERLSGVIRAGETLEIVKYCNVYTTRDQEALEADALKKAGLEALKESEGIGFQELLAGSTLAWKEQVWDAAPIQIESDNPMDQLAMDFAQYHLRVMVPRHDNRMNIAAKGLSGEGYKGHCFWDTEIFLLPYFSFTDPEAARKLMEYRYLTLPGARKKAKENGYEGAMFPWESAWIADGDVTPAYVGANVVTGMPTKVWSGLIEQHITADVAYGTWQYFLTTGDQDFMERFGYEIILDCARFWSSRLEWSDQDGRYHINDVIGADEYKEHCNDNSLTNYLAKWNMEKALECCRQLQIEKPKLYERLDRELGLDQSMALWEERIPLVFLNEPREDNVIGQDADYLSYPEIDMAKYKNQTKVDTILQDYDQTQLSRLQVTKQADLLVLLFMLEDLFPYKVKKACWEYYEPKTTHDSSLSYCTHCVMASDMEDKTLAYDLFGKSWSIDMGENMGTSDAGIHTASIGGIWQCVVMGFGGMRLTDKGIRIDPKLPDNWSALNYTITYQGEKLSVCIQKESEQTRVHVLNLTGKKQVSVLVQDMLIRV